MSSYGTEFEYTDSDDDAMYVNRCCNGRYPLMIYMAGGRYGVEMYREDVERFAAYLASIVDTVPARPVPAHIESLPTGAPMPPRFVACHNTWSGITSESAGTIRDGRVVWQTGQPNRAQRRAMERNK